MGIEHVYEVDAFDIEELEKVIKRETEREEVSVIITKSPCALLKSFVPKGTCVVDTEKCRKCGMCMSSGCPAMSKTEDGTVKIDEVMCNGCGLCQKNCKFDAISLLPNQK